MIRTYCWATVLFLLGCAVKEKPVSFYSSNLFHDVQVSAIFPDSKTFVDCTPKRDLADIVSDYDAIRDKPDFDLGEFVRLNFEMPVRPRSGFVSDTTLSMEEHITKLWPTLTREPDSVDERSSLIPLPYSYVVPGGRFSEVYYWDSYFTILGLKAQKRYDLIQNMIRNFAHLIDEIGFIPNANRDYYLTRSQPPFFSLIIRELEEYDSLAADHYLDAMLREYQFWMDGIDSVKEPGDAVKHVVMLTDGTIMNRYFDKGTGPRPEAYKEDLALAEKHNGDKDKLYRDLRSAAESGWDFSSRWFADGRSIATIHTTDIIPVDLNCLLAHLERMIARGYALRGQAAAGAPYTRRADQRRRAIMTFCWDPAENYFFDYDFVNGSRCTIKSLAGVYPLFFEMVSGDIAAKASTVIRAEFLKPGGLVTTLVDTDQQWDAPNGWAPLQWMTYAGLKKYGIIDLATQIRSRWLRQNERVYEATGKMMEKYNVMDTTLLAGGGEYPNQDGFGWSNGIAVAFRKEAVITLQKK